MFKMRVRTYVEVLEFKQISEPAGPIRDRVDFLAVDYFVWANGVKIRMYRYGQASVSTVGAWFLNVNS